MVSKDISKLKIDKSDAMQYRRVRRKLSLKIAAFIFALVIGFILYRLVFNPVIEVKVSTVSQVYPSQTFTLLNASGYVVAQRKAAVA